MSFIEMNKFDPN